MPIYEFLCESCGDRFEKLVRSAEQAVEDGCPACGEKHLTQEYSTFSSKMAPSRGRVPNAQPRICEQPFTAGCPAPRGPRGGGCGCN